MIKRIQSHFKKKKIRAKAAQPKQAICAHSEDIARKLKSYQPNENRAKANFSGPRVRNEELV